MVFVVLPTLEGMVRFVVSVEPTEAGLNRTVMVQVFEPENGTVWLEHVSEAIVKSVASLSVTCPM